MQMHYVSKNDNSSLVEIDRERYKQLLSTKTGYELAIAVMEAMTVVSNDPRLSELDEAEVFFFYNDVVEGVTTLEELLVELGD